MIRKKSHLDHLISRLDTSIKTVAGGKTSSARPTPAQNLSDTPLSESQKSHIARLMRVNHCGEVCAQALYEGQAFGSGSKDIASTLAQAAEEEEDHLYWCEKRIKEMGGRLSYLNPFFFVSSFAMGTLAGALGRKINLGFLAATEEEVCRHLQRHLDDIPADDMKTRAILKQMLEDEAGHATTALHHGGAVYPPTVKKLMKSISDIMTRTVYWV
ncbi:MAG: 2-polyprenyl-3-methyl-6-methoxy-1,4-benzoquinone monooxygenase [Gammaproteobacteria bacterium]|nr:2-polyprenyl-3-methyl-6-methoxy-1,4-benzoquinone monooxygenase [Gammaproteobacteria bacterium]